MSAFNTQVGGNHYSKYKIQLTEFLIANEIKHGQASVFKYILRHEDKDGIKDILKAIHYIAMIVEKVYPDEKEIQKNLNYVLKKESVVTFKQSSKTGSGGQERTMPMCDLQMQEAMEGNASGASGGRKNERSLV